MPVGARAALAVTLRQKEIETLLMNYDECVFSSTQLVFKDALAYQKKFQTRTS